MADTRAIFKSLFKSPLTSGQLQWESFAKHSDDSDGGHSVSRPTNIIDVTEEGRTEDQALLQLKIKHPKLTPKPKHILTSDEQKQLDKELALANSILYHFKEMLRRQGLDPANCTVSSINNRISYSIPPEHRESFSRFKINKIALAKQLNETPEMEPSKRRGMKM